MDHLRRADCVTLTVGGLARADLETALGSAGVRLNASAETLLEDAMFDSTEATTIQVVQCTVSQLGLRRGATLPRILATARDAGLGLCPPFAGPYLRLAMLDQPTAPDSVMSRGRAPTGSVTVASERLRVDPDHPRGFYLRVVDGRPWLRGYRCTDDAPWHAEDRFAFSVEGGATVR